jgi:hypothetical protein
VLRSALRLVSVVCRIALQLDHEGEPQGDEVVHYVSLL